MDMIHPHYQMWWSRLDGSAFGLQCEKCPSPSETHPAGITFCENEKGEVDRYFKHLMELAKQDPAGLPPLDRFRQSLIRATYPAMKWFQFRFPNARSGRKNSIRPETLSKLLRVLDALADGVSLKEIERVLGNGTNRMGRNLRRQAHQALVDITKISL